MSMSSATRHLYAALAVAAVLGTATPLLAAQDLAGAQAAPAEPAPQAPAPPATAPQAPRPAAQPVRLPPQSSGPVIRQIELRFHPVNQSLIEPQTYLYYIQTQPSRSADGVWVPYDTAAEQKLLDDFKRLWGTSFLDNLWIEVTDAPYDNGVVGKRIVFNMEERPRIKIVD
jgi:hypothetical protein